MQIQPDTAYQKQQETLIVWSEGDNFDLALSFQVGPDPGLSRGCEGGNGECYLVEHGVKGVTEIGA